MATCQVLLAVTCVCPTNCPSLNNCTVESASAFPEIVGVKIFVILSLLLEPLSFDASKFKLVGDAICVSTITVSWLDGTLTFPAESVAVAVNMWCPSLSAPTCICQVPLAVTVVCPTKCPSPNNCTVERASAFPDMVGVEFLVILSLLLIPVSVAGANFKLLGEIGAVVSIIT